MLLICSPLPSLSSIHLSIFFLFPFLLPLSSFSSTSLFSVPLHSSCLFCFVVISGKGFMIVQHPMALLHLRLSFLPFSDLTLLSQLIDMVRVRGTPRPMPCCLRAVLYQRQPEHGDVHTLCAAINWASRVIW